MRSLAPCFLIALALVAPAGAAARGLALVIGNGSYETSPLSNPPNDAADMAKALGELGFHVTREIDANQQTMERVIREFGDRLEQRGGVGIFYYAGHGVQSDGRNYLIPIGALVRSEVDLRYKAVDLGQVMDEMDSASNGLNIVILDACRDNPYRGFRSLSRGLARTDAPNGSLVAYATAPGSVAADGAGRNGIFTKHLLDHLDTPGLTVEQVFKRVRIGVVKETGGAQTPWESSSLVGEFFFRSKEAALEATPEVRPTTVDVGEQPQREPEPKPSKPEASQIASVKPGEPVEHSASASRFHENPDGSVLDRQTRLVWHCAGERETYTFGEAKREAKRWRLGGRWRLPARREVAELSRADKAAERALGRCAHDGVTRYWLSDAGFTGRVTLFRVSRRGHFDFDSSVKSARHRMLVVRGPVELPQS